MEQEALTSDAATDRAARPPTRQELSAWAAEDPGPCRERDPELALTTAPITEAELIVPLLGWVWGGEAK